MFSVSVWLKVLWVTEDETVGWHHWLNGQTCLLVCMPSRFSCAQIFTILWTIACQAPLSMGFSSQEYWSGLPFPFPGDFPLPWIEPTSLMSPALASKFFTTSDLWEPPVGLSLNKLWEIVKDTEAQCAAVHRVTNSWTLLSDWTTLSQIKPLSIFSCLSSV